MLAISLIDLLLFQFNIIETKGKPLSDNMPDKHQYWFKSDSKNIELLPRTIKHANLIPIPFNFIHHNDV